MVTNRKDLIRSLLEAIATGESETIAVVDEDINTPRNPQLDQNRERLAAPSEPLAASPAKAHIARVFEDGDFVFAHTTYDFPERTVAFEVFRFEGDRVIEHKANRQALQAPNPSGHSMVDGEIRIRELEKTESNRELVRAFVEDVLIQRKGEKIYDYVKWNHYVEHNPRGNDDLDLIIAIVTSSGADAADSVVYEKCHRVLVEGNFVLSICEGRVGHAPATFYDLWCLEHDYIVEHWDTTETSAVVTDP
ncbi:MAG: hypothetical protein ACFCUG_09020 [Thiotrichales bacterium]